MGGRIQRRPCCSSGSLRNQGDKMPMGCTAEQRSWTKPGSVSSPERAPPPASAAASSTSTCAPASFVALQPIDGFGHQDRQRPPLQVHHAEADHLADQAERSLAVVDAVELLIDPGRRLDQLVELAPALAAEQPDAVGPIAGVV